jgi:uncharacterized membrane protein
MGVVVVVIFCVVAVLGYVLWSSTGGRKRIELTADQAAQMQKMMGQRPSLGVGGMKPSAAPPMNTLKK